MSSMASTHLLPSATAVSLLPRRVSPQLCCAGDGALTWRRASRLAVARAASSEAAAPAYTSDSLILYFKAEGSMEERAISKINESLELEGVRDLEVLIEEGIGSVVLTKETTVQATGVASNLVEAIQGAGFKLQTLSLSFDDFDEATTGAGGDVQSSE
ncbi:uncharacterized protein LOC133885419 isoform X2 [Phragmites australis]|uniref:uncharacterized protein LOC133885419 isoform X2 n=1 Tax=Phragmites australis TaxID=29695 RepID=UPI002D78BB86|nr:uncharacterized protein LOC133885419 isoform X2 [Phragmites australis]